MKLKGKAKAEFLRRMAAGRRKANKPLHRSPTVHHMAKKRSSRGRNLFSRARGGFRSRGGVRGIQSSLMPYASGIGGGVIGESIALRVAPQMTPIAGYGGAFLFGGVKGLIGKIAIDVISGRSGLLSNLGFGGVQQQVETI